MQILHFTGRDGRGGQGVRVFGMIKVVRWLCRSGCQGGCCGRGRRGHGGWVGRGGHVFGVVNQGGRGQGGWGG